LLDQPFYGWVERGFKAEPVLTGFDKYSFSIAEAVDEEGR
jgi:hypothetical protein